MSRNVPLVLVDGSSYLFRAFHALPPLTNSQGVPTGAIHGVINMLRRLQASYPGAELVVVFDAPGKTFRHERYPDYKANRPPMPEELRRQIEPLHQIVRAQGLPLLVEPGVEADDVIGTMAQRAAAAGQCVVISTGDKDMAQLVDDCVTLVNTMDGVTLDADGVVDKFGVRPAQMVDYLALVGDKVDNIPGVPGCGPKTAVKWLQQYGDIDNLVAHAGEIKGKIGEKLRAALADLPLSRELATIDCKLSLPIQGEALKRGEPDRAALRELYSELEMRTALRELGEPAKDSATNNAMAAERGDTAEDAEIDRSRYALITDAAEFADWLGRLNAVPCFAFDTETTSLNYMQARIVGVSFAIAPGEAAYVPCAHAYDGAPEQLALEDVLGGLAPLLGDPERTVVGQNLKYDLHVLENHGIEVRACLHDTMLQSYLLDAAGNRHDMDSLALKYLGHQCIAYTDIAGRGKAQLPFAHIPIDTAAPYAAEDADVTLRLHRSLWPKLQREKTLRSLYEALELPMLRVLQRIERNGVEIDSAALSKMSEELAAAMVSAESAAHELAGEEFNLNSPKQIQALLYEKLGYPVLRKTPKGQPSTAEDVLEQLAADFPLPRLILAHRSLSKLKSTYTDKLPTEINSSSGRIHTSYNQAVAATGRLSSTEPNLQNVPARTAEGRRIRQAFVAGAGRRILAADYSQIELRIMAHLSEDPGLLAAFAAGGDVHRSTAAEVFETDLSKVSEGQRRAAKAVNFGLIYGMSAHGLARQLGVARNEAQQTIDRYFDRYPGVRHYMERTRTEAHERGYVETFFGRRLYLPDIRSRNPNQRAYAERTAINAPMQGTAADIIKKAMIAVDAWLREEQIDAKMVMQVHDELVFDVAQTDLAALREVLPSLMESVAELAVPLVVDIGDGENWDLAH